MQRLRLQESFNKFAEASGFFKDPRPDAALLQEIKRTFYGGAMAMVLIIMDTDNTDEAVGDMFKDILLDVARNLSPELFIKLKNAYDQPRKH